MWKDRISSTRIFLQCNLWGPWTGEPVPSPCSSNTGAKTTEKLPHCQGKGGKGRPVQWMQGKRRKRTEIWSTLSALRPTSPSTKPTSTAQSTDNFKRSRFWDGYQPKQGRCKLSEEARGEKLQPGFSHSQLLGKSRGKSGRSLLQPPVAVSSLKTCRETCLGHSADPHGGHSYKLQGMQSGTAGTAGQDSSADSLLFCG